MQSQMLAPAAVLVLWSLIVMAWMVVTRMGAFKAMGVDLSKSPPGGRGINLDGVAPDKAQWKSHNYNHLMEQPTLFYATAIILALAGAADLDVKLAWAYVGLRVLHSLWQSLVNTIPVRFTLFGLSSLALAVLAVRAVMATMGHA
ncbi:MAG: MAPEG family protein [Proteobacteria bacterium]|nr:MAPEG family protein [Pseudomonadota bacterium]